MKKIIFLLLPVFMLSCDPADLQKVLDTTSQLTGEETARGLKEALNFGVEDAVSFLSAKDGYNKSLYRILLPEEARKVTDKLKVVPGFSQVEDVILEKINRAAEDAAKSAGPIFLGAIKKMSFTDAMNILMGEKNAATTYLERNTNQALYSEFSPVITNSLNKFNALEYWADAVNAYNKIPFITKVNPDLGDHVTTTAMDGLFSLVEKKEEGIRSDVSQRTTSLLQKVFAKQDGN